MSGRCSVTIAFSGGCALPYGHEFELGLERSPHLTSEECEAYGIATADEITGRATTETPDSAVFDPARFATIEEQEGWFATLAKTVAVDFDGVLHPYTAGWVGAIPADEEPTAGAVAFLDCLVSNGYRVVVFSTRCDLEDGLNGTRAWLEEHGLMPYIDDVTCQKPAAVAYVDDRAVPFTGSWDDVMEGVTRLAAGRPHGAAR